MKITNQMLYTPTVRNTKSVHTGKEFSVDKTSETKELSKEEEMAAFKKEFYDDLSKIKSHRTVSNLAVNVSEEAFKAMKEDPKYREKVLSLIQRDCGGSYGSRNASLLITVGATLGEYRGDAWPVDYDSEFHMRSQDSFYERKSKKKEVQEEILEEYLKKQRAAKKLQQNLNNKVNILQASMAYEANVWEE